MRKLLRAWSLFALAALASCQGDADGTQTSSKDQPVAAPAKPLQLTTSSVGLVPQQTANGIKVHLEDRFQNAVIARRNADGSITTECHDEEAGAQAFMAGAAAPKAEVK